MDRRQAMRRGLRLLVCTALTVAAAGAEPLLPNGDFGQAGATPEAPAHWDVPDGLGIRWETAPDGGRAIRMDTRVSEQALVAQWQRRGLTEFAIPHPGANAVAETYGLSYYSDPIPVQPGVRYRVAYEALGVPAGMKVWVRGYARVDGEERRLWEHLITGGNDASHWQHVSAEVAPTAHRPVERIRIMLFAYYPAGVYWFRRLTVTPVP